jgi:hypothetical protein
VSVKSPAQAAFDVLCKLGARTHYAPEPTDSRGKSLTRSEAIARAKKGRKRGPKALRRHAWLKDLKPRARIKAAR